MVFQILKLNFKRFLFSLILLKNFKAMVALGRHSLQNNIMLGEELLSTYGDQTKLSTCYRQPNLVANKNTIAAIHLTIIEEHAVSSHRKAELFSIKHFVGNFTVELS